MRRHNDYDYESRRKIFRLGKLFFLACCGSCGKQKRRNQLMSNASPSLISFVQNHTSFLFYCGKGINLSWLTWNEWLTFFVLHSAKQRFERSISSKSSLCKDKHTKRRKFNFWALRKKNFKRKFSSPSRFKARKGFFFSSKNSSTHRWSSLKFIWCVFSLVTLETCLWKIFSGKIEAERERIFRCSIIFFPIKQQTNLGRKKVARAMFSLENTLESGEVCFCEFSEEKRFFVPISRQISRLSLDNELFLFKHEVW